MQNLVGLARPTCCTGVLHTLAREFALDERLLVRGVLTSTTVTSKQHSIHFFLTLLLPIVNFPRQVIGPRLLRRLGSL